MVRIRAKTHAAKRRRMVLGPRVISGLQSLWIPSSRLLIVERGFCTESDAQPLGVFFEPYTGRAGPVWVLESVTVSWGLMSVESLANFGLLDQDGKPFSSRIERVLRDLAPRLRRQFTVLRDEVVLIEV